MPIDASIPLSIKQPQIEDPTNALLKVLQIQGLQDSRAKEQRSFDSENALNAAYGGALGADGSLDRNKLYSLLAGRGQGARIPTVQKSFADVDKTQSETDQNKAKAEAERVQAAHTRIDVIGQASAWVRQNPTAENAIAATQHLQQNGILTPEQAQASIARIQADPSPQTIAQNADMAFRSAVQAKDQLPKLTDFAAGDRHVNQSIDPITGKVTETGSTVIGQSADNVATNATSRANNAATVGATLRGQNLVDARSRESNAQGRVPAGYRQKADGSLEFIPGGPADPNAAKRAAPTEFQGKAAMFGTRAQEADKIITQLEGQYSPSGINTKQALGHTPLVGGALEAGGNALLSDASQKAEQAQRDFVNAVLRLESGAAIGKDEFDNARKQYFPQPNDRPEVKAQKAQNRKTAIQGLMNNARPGAVEQSGGATGSFAPASSPDVDALVRKYGGK